LFCRARPSVVCLGAAFFFLARPPGERCGRCWSQLGGGHSGDALWRDLGANGPEFWASIGLRCGPGGPTWPLAPGPLGSVAGDPDRHQGWLFCPSSVPAAGGRGLRPRVFSAHRPWPQLQAQAPARVVTARPLAKRLQTGHAFLLQAIFTIWPDLVPIQTGAPA
jgi:hypothetical protein